MAEASLLSFPFPALPARCRFSLSPGLQPRNQHERGLCGGESQQNKRVFRFPFGPRVLPVLRLLSLELRCRILFTSSVSVPEIAWSCELVVSVLRHMSMHRLLRVGFLSWRSLFLSCLLLTPRTSHVVDVCYDYQKESLHLDHLPFDVHVSYTSKTFVRQSSHKIL